jgi:hypothetical protein
MPPPMAVVPIYGRFGCWVGRRLNAEGAAYPANDAANDATDDSAKGSCCLGTHRCAMRNTVGYTLRLCRKRTSK